MTSKIEKTKVTIAVLFNKQLFSLCEADYIMNDPSSRATFAVSNDFYQPILSFVDACTRDDRTIHIEERSIN